MLVGVVCDGKEGGAVGAGEKLAVSSLEIGEENSKKLAKFSRNKS